VWSRCCSNERIILRLVTWQVRVVTLRRRRRVLPRLRPGAKEREREGERESPAYDLVRRGGGGERERELPGEFHAGRESGRGEYLVPPVTRAERAEAYRRGMLLQAERLLAAVDRRCNVCVCLRVCQHVHGHGACVCAHIRACIAMYYYYVHYMLCAAALCAYVRMCACAHTHLVSTMCVCAYVRMYVHYYVRAFGSHHERGWVDGWVGG
jgi:hypothetical protein